MDFSLYILSSLQVELLCNANSPALKHVYIYIFRKTSYSLETHTNNNRTSIKIGLGQTLKTYKMSYLEHYRLGVPGQAARRAGGCHDEY